MFDYCGQKEEDFNICHGYKIFTTHKKLPYMQRQVGVIMWDFKKIIDYMSGTSNN
jgi:hypothetical protein